MIKRIWKLVVLGVIVALAVAFIIQNLSPITVQITPMQKIEARSGVIMLASFVLGMLATIIFWIAFGIRAYFRERSLLNKDKKREAFYQDQLEARSYLATGQYRKAVDAWEAVLRREPKNIVARVELSRALEAQGKLADALKCIEEGRAAQGNAQELYFRAAELHALLENPTAGLDNIRLALQTQASLPAAELARDFAEQLEKYEDALSYHEQARSLGGKGDEFEDKGTELERLLILQSSPEIGTRILGLRKLLKRNPKNARVLASLIEAIESTGNPSEAAQVYIDLAKKENNSKAWLRAMNFWLRNKETEKAVSLGNSALRHLEGAEKLEFDIHLACLLLQANKIAEAREKLEQIVSTEQEHWEKLTEPSRLRYIAAQALLAQRSGAVLQSSKYLELTLQSDLSQKPALITAEQEALQSGVQGPRAAPALQLSTP